MHVAPQTVGVAAHDESHLRVRLEADDPIAHVRAGTLQTMRPLDVVLFIAPGLELEHDGDLLAAVDCFQQGLHEWRGAADTVQCVLYGQHRGVGCGTAYEVVDRRERLVRVVKEHVARPNRGK